MMSDSSQSELDDLRRRVEQLEAAATDDDDTDTLAELARYQAQAYENERVYERERKRADAAEARAAALGDSLNAEARAHDETLAKLADAEQALKGHRMLDETYALAAAEQERDAARRWAAVWKRKARSQYEVIAYLDGLNDEWIEAEARADALGDSLKAEVKAHRETKEKLQACEQALKGHRVLDETYALQDAEQERDKWRKSAFTVEKEKRRERQRAEAAEGLLRAVLAWYDGTESHWTHRDTLDAIEVFPRIRAHLDGKETPAPASGPYHVRGHDSACGVYDADGNEIAACPLQADAERIAAALNKEAAA